MVDTVLRWISGPLELSFTPCFVVALLSSLKKLKTLTKRSKLELSNSLARVPALDSALMPKTSSENALSLTLPSVWIFKRCLTMISWHWYLFPFSSLFLLLFALLLELSKLLTIYLMRTQPNLPRSALLAFQIAHKLLISIRWEGPSLQLLSKLKTVTKTSDLEELLQPKTFVALKTMPNTARKTKTITLEDKDLSKELRRHSLVKESDNKPSLHLLRSINSTHLQQFTKTANQTMPSSWELEVTLLDLRKPLPFLLTRMVSSLQSTSLTLVLEVEVLHLQEDLETQPLLSNLGKENNSKLLETTLWRHRE